MSIGFTNFRRKLEDEVTVAINTGRSVDQRFGCCPLGVLTYEEGKPNLRRPGYNKSAAVWGITRTEAEAFADGFDGVIAHDPVNMAGILHPDFYSLGRMYKERFKDK